MKRVVITGASRGIGQATAEKFQAKGFDVIGTSTTGKNAQISLDLSNPQSIENADYEIKKQGSLDIFINNAAIEIDDLRYQA